jgi:hypothetical protein
MPQLSVWVGAGLVSAGVSAALIAGAGAASAATDADSDSGGTTTSDSQRPSSSKLHPGPAAQPRRPDARPNVRTKSRPSRDQRATADTKAQAGATDAAPSKRKRVHLELGARTTRPATPAPDARPDALAARLRSIPAALEDTVAHPFRDVLTNTAAAQSVSERLPRPSLGQLRLTAAAAPGAHIDVERPVGGVIATIGSALFDALQSVETAVTGPPVVPPGSHVTVQSSTIQLDNGDTVPANWYFPETSDGTPPTQVILLQHGFLALGPMYSYTAAALAEQTGSIVVTPTLSSNPFAGDDHWLGGSGMAASVGHLFEGDRAALTQSARDAGYETFYGLAPGTGELPKPFALMGHSLGANLVAGAAGTLAADCTAQECAADDLVGVILLDGVPMGNTLPDALAELDAKEALTGYVPVREIGAPFNAWNSLSSVNEQLTAARPDHFNGVVLDGGVHSDAMSGGNPLIQLALYLVAGFPEPQNPPAVETLSAQWLNDWFAGDTDNGDDLAPGTTVDISTPNGTAHGVVIGTAPPLLIAWFHQLVTELETSAVTHLPTTNPTLAILAA